LNIEWSNEELISAEIICPSEESIPTIRLKDNLVSLENENRIKLITK
jgi:hypothetical protein